MNWQAIGEVCGFIGGTIGIAQGLPQVMRIRRLGHSNGVLLSPWILMSVMFSAWVGFGLKVQSPAIYITNALTFITTSLVVTAIKGRKFLAIQLAIAFASSAFVFYGPELLTNLLLVILTASRVPQLIKTWMNRKSAVSTAVSIEALVISLVSVAFWMAYAIMQGNFLVIGTSVVAMSVTLATAIIETRISKQAATLIG